MLKKIAVFTIAIIFLLSQTIIPTSAALPRTVSPRWALGAVKYIEDENGNKYGTFFMWTSDAYTLNGEINEISSYEIQSYAYIRLSTHLQIRGSTGLIYEETKFRDHMLDVTLTEKYWSHTWQEDDEVFTKQLPAASQRPEYAYGRGTVDGVECPRYESWDR